MSAVLDHTDETGHDDPHDHAEGHAHPSDKTYWMVGLFLAVVTAAEIALADLVEGPLAAAGLLIMMVVKFGTVCAMFMHLRFDNKLLRNLFLIGIFLAMGCYAAAAGAMSFWDNSGRNVIVDPPQDQLLPPQPTLPAPIPHPGGEGH